MSVARQLCRGLSTFKVLRIPSAPMDLETVQDHQRKGSAVLIDVRSQGELNNHGVVNGALHVPVDYVDEAFSMNDEQFKATIGNQKPESDKTVIFFCVKGIRAKNAADLAADKFKFKNSFFYTGPFVDLQ